MTEDDVLLCLVFGNSGQAWWSCWMRVNPLNLLKCGRTSSLCFSI